MLPTITLVGRLTKAPQLSYLPNQTPIVDFGVACNEKYGEKENVCFLNCVVFGKSAEALNKHFTVGKPIELTGKLKTEQWVAKDGSKKSKQVLGVDRWGFVLKDSSSGEAKPAAAPNDAPPPSDDNIPF